MQKTKENTISNNHGSMLIQAFLGITLSSIALLGFMKGFHWLENNLFAAHVRSDALSISQTLDGLADCAQSMVLGTTCPAATATIAVLKADGSDLVAQTGTTFGKITLRARCNTRNNGIVIEGALLKPMGNLESTNIEDFRYDSSRGIPYDWNHPQLQFSPPGLSRCITSLPPTSTPTIGPSLSNTRLLYKLIYSGGHPTDCPKYPAWYECPKLGSQCASGKTYFYNSSGASGKGGSCSCYCQ